ncbi:MAG: protein translocase subunit SecD, partial [Chthoniobacterales bacterium]
MSPTWTFLFGLFLLCLFAAYFLVEKEQTKRLLGTALTILLCAFCIYSFYPPSAKIHYGLDLQGGSSFLVRLVPPKDENGKPRAITPDMQQQAVEVIRRRVDQFGVSEPVITSQGSDRILVQIPGLDTAKIDEARAQLQRVAKLEFKLVNPQSGTLLPQIESGQTFTPPGYEILNGVKSSKTGQPEKYLVKKKPELTGAEVTRAQARFEQRGYEVDLSFNSEGGKTFARVTGQNIGNQLAIVLDGEVISAPVIQSEISNNSASITGNFTAQEAQDLASALQNPLQTPVVIDEVRSVSATLGQDSISRGLASGLAGLAATLIFVLIYYRTAGAVALIGLAVNGILLFGAMSLFGFVLTLPGIAGVILTIGMAIDANVLIYERLREEIGAGKSLKASIDTAYRKAFSAIFDANVTTLLKVVILFWLGSGPVKGFAITLTLGIIASMFSALLVTRNIFGWLIRFNLMKRISMLHLISSKHFDFLGKWKISVIASIVLLAASGIAFGVRGANMFNLDFTGGDSLVLRSDKPVDEAQVRSQLEKVGLGSAVIQQESSQRNQQTVHLIAIRAPYGSGQKILSELKASPQTSGLV